MTIKDIARESGYAVGTVSRVLNNHPDVSEKARERILAVVAKNGYTQNANAKNLKQSVNRSLLVLVKGIRNELFAALVEQLQGLMNNTPYTLLVDYFDEDTDEVQRAITLCAEKKPQGILFLGGNADNFKRSFGRITLPAVLVTSPAEGLDYPNLSSVTTDDFEASVQAVRVLLEHGHRHIAIIGGRPSFSDVSGQRFAGGRAAFVQSGLPAENLVEYGEARFCYEEGYQAMHHVLEEHPEITVVRCENTAAAAEAVAKSERTDVAAISSYNCVELYGLERLAADIQDRSNNYTRFICISKKLEIYPGADKTSLMLVLPHRPGALYQILGRFYALGMNLIKLESRPLPDREFEFMFYFDLETSVYSDEFIRLVDDLDAICEEFQYLGSYSEVI